MKKRWFVTLGAVALAACGGRPAPQAASPVVYPPPPDTARIQYLTSISSERDLGRGGRSWLDRIAGTEGEKDQAINKPYGLAVAGDRLYVCDEGFGGLDIVDLARRRIEFFTPDTPYPIRRAVNCSTDQDGNLYVVDVPAKRVIVYDSTRTWIAAFGGEDDVSPVDVVAAGDRLFVSNLEGTPRIRVYDRHTRTFLYGFPDVPTSDSTGLAAPTNLIVADDTVWVSDMLKQQVFVYTAEGQFVRTVGRPGLGPSTFQRPKGIARDRDGLLYVVDAAFENVQIFTPEGRLLMFFGGSGVNPGQMILPAKIVIHYGMMDRFQRFARPGAQVKYLIFVTNQYGPNKINVYGFIGPTGYAIPPVEAQ